MSKVRLRSVNDNWGGVVIININTIKTDDAKKIYNKVENMVNTGVLSTFIIYNNKYLGNAEFIGLSNNIASFRNISVDYYNDVLQIEQYNFTNEGNIGISSKKYNFQDIFSRLDAIEEKLNEITTE